LEIGAVCGEHGDQGREVVVRKKPPFRRPRPVCLGLILPGRGRLETRLSLRHGQSRHITGRNNTCKAFLETETLCVDEENMC
jgi:hypothetical protein